MCSLFLANELNLCHSVHRLGIDATGATVKTDTQTPAGIRWARLSDRDASITQNQHICIYYYSGNEQELDKVRGICGE